MGQGGGFLKFLIDSSVWIPFLRGHSELPNEVSVAMSEGKETAVGKLNPIFSTAVDRSKRLPVVVNELDKKSGGHSKVVAA